MTKMVPDATELCEVAQRGGGFGASRRWKIVILENEERMDRSDRTVLGIWQIADEYLRAGWTGRCMHGCMHA